MASTPIPAGMSYEFQNLVRDMDPVFRQLLALTPILLSRIAIGEPAANTKVEWLEDTLAPVQATISALTDQTHFTLSVTSGTGFKAGSIIRFATSGDVSRTELQQIVSNTAGVLVTSATYGGSTGATKAVGDKVYLVASPRLEGTDPLVDYGQEPAVAYNYTQIFDTTAKVSRTSQAIRIYGLDNALDYEVQNGLKRLAFEMNNSSIFGMKVQRSGANQGTLGGILQYLAGGNVDTTGGAVSATIINNMLEAIFKAGGYGGRFGILCNTNQARKMSAFLYSQNTPIMHPDSAMIPYGNAILQFRGDLPVQQGFQADVIVEPNFPKDQIAIVDFNRLALRPLVASSLIDKDATPPGADYFQRRIIGEYTLEVKNGQQAHALATGLTP